MVTSPIPVLVKPRRFSDDRGWFSETYSSQKARALGITDDFIQDNQSFSATAGTIRGLHFQLPPFAQGKLVRCLSGSIIDYAVDIRRGSPTFGKWVSALLTADGGEQLYVPVGYAHGFVTKEDNTNVAYKVTNFYSPESEGGIIWNDPDISINWDLNDRNPILSLKDTEHKLLREFDSPFPYDGTPLSAIEQKD